MTRSTRYISISIAYVELGLSQNDDDGISSNEFSVIK